MYCKHWLNFGHRDNKNDFKQLFQQELACTAVYTHNVHKSNHAGRVQEGGNGTICFGDIMDNGAGSCLGAKQDITRKASWCITLAQTRISTLVHHTSNSVATSS
jgi:hypothetical protein